MFQRVVFFPSENTTGLLVNPEHQTAPEEMITEQSVEPETRQCPPQQSKSPLFLPYQKVAD